MPMMVDKLGLTDKELLKQLEGKIIAKIETPEKMEITKDNYSLMKEDDNILIIFTDGTQLKLASWDYEGYSSGIYKEIINE